MTTDSLPAGPRASKWLQLLGTWTRPTATLEGLRPWITFSPRGGAAVVLTERAPAPRPAPPVAVPA